MGFVIDHLCFSYGQRMVLRDLSLDLAPGKLTFLLGANGSGKSTLLKLLCGLLEPQSGNILLDGKLLKQYPPRLRAQKIGVQLQTPPPALDFTVEEFVMFGRNAKLPHLAPPQEADHLAVKNALAAVRMSAFAPATANCLSGGEFQRVALASVLALESGILLLDEPVSAQDPAHSAMLFHMLRQLARERLILVISHDLQFAQRYGERVLLLADGKIFADGDAENVLTTDNLQKLYQVPDLTVSRHPYFCFESK